LAKYLITGGAGFIGSTVANLLLQNDQEVTVIDDLSMGKRDNLADSSHLRFLKHTITDHEIC